MLFRGKTPQEITEQHLRDLIGINHEDETVDFKTDAYNYPEQDTQGKGKEKKKEALCKDVSAFANAKGGWIVCGMKEDKGQASELTGLPVGTNSETEISRLESWANEGIEPSIPGLTFHPIPLNDANKGPVILIRIPRSYRAPHRVKNTGLFHIRRSGRNDAMNMDELRDAFNLSETLIDKIRDFRKERIEILLNPENSDEIPVALPPLTEGTYYFALHILPIDFSRAGSGVDLSRLKLQFPNSRLITCRAVFYNLDGLVIDEFDNSNTPDSFALFYRHGGVEFAAVQRKRQDQRDYLVNPHYDLEDQLIHDLDIILHIMQKQLQVSGPIAIMLSLLGLKGCRFSSNHWANRNREIARNKALIPEIVLEEYPFNDDDLKRMLKPLFDMVWNLGGFDRSNSYDQEGNWTRNNK